MENLTLETKSNIQAATNMLEDDEQALTVQVSVSKYVNTPVACVGIVLNLITFYVWSGVRRVRLMTYMFKILAAVETTFLLLYLVWLYNSFSADTDMYEQIRWEDVFLNTSGRSLTYIVVFVTTCIALTRYVKVFYPGFFQKVVTIKGFKIAFVAYSLFTLTHMGTKHIMEKFSPVEKRWLLDKIFTVPTYTLFLFLPTFVQAVLITQLLLGVSRAASVVLPSSMIEHQTGTSSLTHRQSSQPKEPAEYKDNQNKLELQRKDQNILDDKMSDDLQECQAKIQQHQTKHKIRHRQVTCALACIVFVSFVSYGVMPIFVMFSYIQELSAHKWTIYSLKHFFNVLNSSINFFFYYWIVDEFRSLFKKRMPQINAGVSWATTD